MSGTSRLRPRTLLVVALALSAVAVVSAALWQRFETDAAGPGSGMSLVVSDTTVDVGQKITVSVIMDDAPTVANNGPCSDGRPVQARMQPTAYATSAAGSCR